MIRVIIADDHSLIRRSIRVLLEKSDDIEVIDEARDGQEVIELVQRLMPDVLVMDIVMPHVNGIEATERVCNLGLATRIIILSMHSDETLVQQALQNGARGYVLKESTTKDLPLAVRATDRGEIYLSPAISAALHADFSDGQADDKIDLDNIDPLF